MVIGLVQAQKTVYATVELVDVAGVQAGQAKEGGFNPAMMQNLRQVDALVHVVRAFDNPCRLTRKAASIRLEMLSYLSWSSQLPTQVSLKNASRKSMRKSDAKKVRRKTCSSKKKRIAVQIQRRVSHRKNHLELWKFLMTNRRSFAAIRFYRRSRC